MADASSSTDASKPCWLTASISGSGGVLRADARDFCVDEILPYAASGKGEHAFIHIRKVGLTTPEAIEALSRASGIPRNLFGCAGFKDKHAIATQYLSVQVPIKQTLPDFGGAESEQLSVLSVQRHENKLRRGHQRGNRFAVTIREVPTGGFERAAGSLSQLKQKGVPNFFGAQRFGREGDNVARALEMLRGERPFPRNRRIADLLCSSVQSEIFNDVLRIRMNGGYFDKALLGDVMQKHDTGGLFDVDDVKDAQARMDANLISPTGPIHGKKTRAAHGVPAEMEMAALTKLGLGAEKAARLGEGTRRKLRYPLDPSASVTNLEENAYRVEVTLPSGSYVTVLLAELIKPESGFLDRTFEA